jgi:hypothetical protein
MRGVDDRHPQEQPGQDAAWEFAKWLSSRSLASRRKFQRLIGDPQPAGLGPADPGTKGLPYVEALLASLPIAKERPRLREFADIQALPGHHRQAHAGESPSTPP